MPTDLAPMPLIVHFGKFKHTQTANALNDLKLTGENDGAGAALRQP